MFYNLLLNIIVLTVLPLGVAQAQTEESRPAPPLVLKVSVAQRKLCLGSTVIELQAELTNVSSNKVAIDKKGVQPSSYWFYKAGDKVGEAALQAPTFSYPLNKPDYLTLEPQRTYQLVLTIPLTSDNQPDEFSFQRFGRYKVQAKYNAGSGKLFDNVPVFTETLYSNEVEFKIVSCAK